MSSLLNTSTLLAALFLSWCLGPASRAGEASEDEAGRQSKPVPVLVELFTSQGCSSCPPADRLLRRLGEERSAEAVGLAGVEVIPLSFHVDYWNRLGWSDPFSAAQWSHRQGRYASILAASNVYTPQMVVDGREDCVGSNHKELSALLAEAARREKAGLIVAETTWGPKGALVIDLEAELLRPSEPLQLVVALFETGLETEVARGENARRILRNDFVVRRLEKVGTLAGKAGDRRRETLRWRPHREWRAENLGVVAFLQDPETMAVEGLVRADPP